MAHAFAAAAGPPVMRLGVYAGDVSVLTAPEEKVWGRALGREQLDLLLCDAAVAAGAQLFQPAQMISLRRKARGFTCVLDEAEIAADTVIAACGSWNTKGMFAVTSQAAPSDLFAFKAHFTASSLPAGLMPLLAFPGGYGGLVQSDAGRTSLSCCIRRDALARVRACHPGKAAQAVLAHIMATTRGVREALGPAARDGSFLSIGPLRPGIRARYQDGVFFTGNIAGDAHPIIAEGISMAIQASGLLAKLLIAHRGDEYAVAWKRRFAPRILRFASLFAHLATNDSAAHRRLGDAACRAGLGRPGGAALR